MKKVANYAILSKGSTNAYGGGGGELVAVIEAKNKAAAIDLALAAGVSVYNGQYLEAVPSSKVRGQLAEQYNEAVVLVPCACGREVSAWRAALGAGNCQCEAEA